VGIHLTEFEKRIKDEQKGFVRITNEDLVCKDCKHKWDDNEILGNTSRCDCYQWKPNSIIVGGKCEKYEKE
jgi:hypothetical protein